MASLGRTESLIRLDGAVNYKCTESSDQSKQVVSYMNNGKTETYTYLTSTTFKARLGTHKTSFKNPNGNQTSLLIHIKKLDKKNIAHTIKWDTLISANPFSPQGRI